jgi:hypothetical protein
MAIGRPCLEFVSPSTWPPRALAIYSTDRWTLVGEATDSLSQPALRISPNSMDSGGAERGLLWGGSRDAAENSTAY